MMVLEQLIFNFSEKKDVSMAILLFYICYNYDIMLYKCKDFLK